MKWIVSFEYLTKLSLDSITQLNEGAVDDIEQRLFETLFGQ